MFLSHRALATPVAGWVAMHADMVARWTVFLLTGVAGFQVKLAG
jgi:hypothetical protein